ncbi:MAG: GntR family transcriptional regulator [Rhodobacteraceae bacterium]|nr:GntR family transcriptional regulator [Paracoccaceae bacterium]
MIVWPFAAGGRLTHAAGGAGMPAVDQQSASARELAHARIRELILSGGLVADEPVSERQLAERLGLGRTPVREALKSLAREGVLDVLPMRGTFLRQPSIDDMREIYEILTALECMAAEIVAARQPGETELAPLTLATDDMEAALAADDLDAWAAADERFHASLIELSGNRQLAATVWNYWDRAHRARMFSLKLRPSR